MPTVDQVTTTKLHFPGDSIDHVPNEADWRAVVLPKVETVRYVDYC